MATKDELIRELFELLKEITVDHEAMDFINFKAYHVNKKEVELYELIDIAKRLTNHAN